MVAADDERKATASMIFSVVAFESLASEGVEMAAHADIDDEDQTVRFLDIHTTAIDKTDGDKLVTGSEASTRSRRR